MAEEEMNTVVDGSELVVEEVEGEDVVVDDEIAIQSEQKDEETLDETNDENVEDQIDGGLEIEVGVGNDAEEQIPETIEEEKEKRSESEMQSETLTVNAVSVEPTLSPRSHAVFEMEHKVSEAKLEREDLQEHMHNLMRQAAVILDCHGGELGLGVEMAVISDANNLNEEYLNGLEQVSYLHEQYVAKQKELGKVISELNDRVVLADEKAEKIRDAFKEVLREMSTQAVNKRNGKGIPMKWILQKEEEMEVADKNVETHRLKFIHYKMQVKKLNRMANKRRDALRDGLHVIDLEQLKIENQTLNEKIEERNDSIYKVRSKVDATIEVLTHLRAKLQFVEESNVKLHMEQNDMDGEVKLLRDELTVLKKKRDKLRQRHGKLKQRRGFLANDSLLADFTQRKNRVVQIEQQIAQLQAQVMDMNQIISESDRLKHSLSISDSIF